MMCAAAGPNCAPQQPADRPDPAPGEPAVRGPQRFAARSGTANELAVAADALTLNAASRSRRACDMTSAFAVCAEAREFHAASVVGSIIFLTSVILVAGKPLTSACLRMMASSLAR